MRTQVPPPAPRFARAVICRRETILQAVSAKCFPVGVCLPGVFPSSRLNKRTKLRAIMAARLARESTESSCRRWLGSQASRSPSGWLSGVCASRVALNCAWSPVDLATEAGAYVLSANKRTGPSHFTVTSATYRSEQPLQAWDVRLVVLSPEQRVIGPGGCGYSAVPAPQIRHGTWKNSP
jgi:hypothetical protein